MTKSVEQNGELAREVVSCTCDCPPKLHTDFGCEGEDWAAPSERESQCDCRWFP